MAAFGLGEHSKRPASAPSGGRPGWYPLAGGDLGERVTVWVGPRPLVGVVVDGMLKRGPARAGRERARARQTGGCRRCQTFVARESFMGVVASDDPDVVAVASTVSVRC